MKPIKLIFTVSFLLLSLGYSALAQQKDVNDPAFIAKVEKDAAEVFKNHMEYAGKQFMPVYIERLSRLSIEDEAISPNEGYQLLSDIALIDKYNPEITRDNAQTFKPETFNALKYAIEYESKSVKKIRVDNTGYVLVIHPKQ